MNTRLEDNLWKKSDGLSREALGDVQQGEGSPAQNQPFFKRRLYGTPSRWRARRKTAAFYLDR